jgi:putative tryptophan/tyrosine transport system substrate-binding protein
MRRRRFLVGLGALAVAPAARGRAHATIGYFSSRSAAAEAPLFAWFGEGLAELGFAMGRNLSIERRFSEGRDGRLPALATELLARNVDLLVPTDRPSAMAAKAATATVPIVFASGGDPVEFGLVASFARPGGNATGVAILTTSMGPKRLELLCEVLPPSAVVAFLYYSASAVAAQQVEEVRQVAAQAGRRILALGAATEAELEGAFAAMRANEVGGFLTSANLYFQVHARRIVALAQHYAIPGMYEWPEFVAEGGLMSYSTSRAEALRLAGRYAARVLTGEKPANLPVIEPTRLELAINLRTAQALGITLPPALLARADEVIE